MKLLSTMINNKRRCRLLTSNLVEEHVWMTNKCFLIVFSTIEATRKLVNSSIACYRNASLTKTPCPLIEFENDVSRQQGQLILNEIYKA
mmetsp:Transcript_58911/g.68848  ORF Transcript_58911/g.68848 Transcript_58911/m.68848 type:complete len:89 (-) Transcript_58911:382-648(-)